MSFYLILWSYKLSQNISYQWENRKRETNVKTAVSLLNLKTSLKFCFLSMIKCWKLILCIWNRRICEVLNSQTAFWLIVARQWPENSLISFKKQFSAKFPGVNGLKIMTEHATYFEKADHSTLISFGWETADRHCGQWNGKGYYMYYWLPVPPQWLSFPLNLGWESELLFGGRGEGGWWNVF